MTQPVTVPYISLAEVKDYLQINSNTYDARLGSLISYACAVVESYIGREVKSNTYTETFDGGTTQVFVSRLPLNSVQSITEFNGTNHDYLVGPKNDGSFVADNFNNSDVSSSAVLKTRRKKFGLSSAYFDGQSHIGISDPESDNQKFDFQTDDFTIEGYFRFEDISNTKTMISRGDSVSNKVELVFDPSLGAQSRAVSGGTETVNVHHFTSSASVTGYYTANTNTFQHYAVCRNDNTIRLFIDGNRVKTQTTSNTLPSLTHGSANNLVIGKNNISGSENYFKGYADEIRVTIDSKYTESFTAPTSQLTTDDNTVLLLHMDGINGSNAVKDVSRSTPQFIWNAETGSIKRYVGGSSEGNPDISVIPEYTFRNYPRGVKVTYNAGYTTIPQDLKVATLDYVKILHKQTQENAGYSLQGESGKQHTLSANFPPHIRRVLEMYRLMN